MNVLYLISGLSILTLVAELANFRRWLPAIVMAGLAFAAWMLFSEGSEGNVLGKDAEPYFYNMIVFDSVAVAFSSIIVVAAFFWFWLAAPSFRTDPHQTDRMSLVLFVTCGALMLSSFGNLATLFLGIEILSIPLYVLAGSRKDSIASTEASFKYFLMGSFATGFLLFGIALLYGATGTFDLSGIAEKIVSNEQLPSFYYPGVVLIMIGLGFKMSAVPFHFWAPDVYEGSPTMITALMSTVVKVAAVAAFLRILSVVQLSGGSWPVVLQVMMILTLVVPNITAVYQSSVKRMLAYSSVGHVGFLLLALLVGAVAHAANESIITYYLTAYVFSSLAAFAVLSIVENESGSVGIEAFRGLGRKSPLLAITMTIAMMSLAGIPPLAGFFAKYLVLASALKQGFIGSVILAVVMSLVGVFYYFRVIITMFFGEPSTESYSLRISTRVILILLVAAIIGSGIFVEYLSF